jgi:signal transduction histidine kinase/pSer/pThr/pTyr-binding forkhead associated (FHA) protein
LLVLQGPDKGRRFELPDEPALVGRESRSLPLTDNTVSRRHAELLPDNGAWVLKDLGSSNGSYVNGARVTTRHALKLGDQIRVGRTLMVFGTQPGVTRTTAGNVRLTGAEAGMDSAIIAAVPSNEDSMVLSVPEPAAAAMNNLRVLYELSALLGGSFDQDQVLEVVMDLVFEHVKADRGIILMIDPRTRDVTPKVVRVRDETSAADKKATNGMASNGSGEKIHASRTIINHVLETGEGVLSSNAMTDQRFSKGKSVHNLGIRSALCVPIKARKLPPPRNAPPTSLTESAIKNVNEEILGVIYVDSSVRNHTYVQDQLRLLTAIGVQAGLAIQNAKLYQQGLAAERLAAVGETTAALSHSVKNILQALRGGADVVEMGFKSQNIVQATKGWRVVERNLDKIYNLTLNLLAYSKPREPAMEMVNLKKLIDECLELVSNTAADKGVMAVADVEGEIPAVPLDPDGMHQVLMNLLSNALDAVPSEGGLVRVECRYDEENQQAVIHVIDNGPGIPPLMMKHMFELFHSTKGNRGTGLGLAVAKKIVDEHEGSITAKSSSEEGTTFTVRLPVYHEGAADPSQTHGPRR